jgi:hypothetical protein
MILLCIPRQEEEDYYFTEVNSHWPMEGSVFSFNVGLGLDLISISKKLVAA